MADAPRRNWTRAETLLAFRLYCGTPFGRLHQSNPDIVAPADVEGIMVFLASDDAAFATGGLFAVDGGMTTL